MNSKTIRISVRNLVEFILREGDLDNRHKKTSDKEAMQKGSRLHRKIQKQRKAGYESEVPLSYKKEYEEFSILVEGRADGIFTESEEVCIEEIKGTFLDLQKIEEPVPVHLAQAMCYGLFYCEEKNLEQIGIVMTYGNLESEELKDFRIDYTRKNLQEWFDTILDAYYKWAKFQHDWQTKRNASMQDLEFPFPYRKGQRDMVVGVYRTILQKKEIFVQAPTGVGKTMSTIFPAVRAVGEGYGDKIFYLTAKTITRTVAQEAFAILAGRGLAYKVITLTAKEKLCPQEEMTCDPQHCSCAKGHYDRVNDAVFELLNQEDAFDRETILAYAEKWNVCPFEMALDLSVWTDAIICDYNYVFDPNVKLKRFFSENRKNDYIFLIDEAHNLVERGRQMYSADLYKEDVLAAKKWFKTQYPKSIKLQKALDRLNRQMLEYKRECEDYQILDSIGNLLLSCMNIAGAWENWQEEHPQAELSDEMLNFYFAMRDFLNIADILDENYVIYSEHDYSGRFRIKQYCVNPAVNIQECVNKGVSAVFFSATLLPIAYYRSMFSTNPDDFGIYIESPFENDHKKLLISEDVTSRYTRRGQEEYEKMASYIRAVVGAEAGNYLVFFPSYQMMNAVYEIFMENSVLENQEQINQEQENQEQINQEQVNQEQINQEQTNQEQKDDGKRAPVLHTEIILQNASMKEQEREEFLNHFSKEESNTLGFCVMGGIFSEGIDLIGEKLIGAIIIGTGIPQINNEKEILKNYYDKKNHSGFDYAYRFPGMNKVLQSAGRVIRTSEDRGVIALLDERFLNVEYSRLFPKEWTDYKRCTLASVGEEVSSFWRRENV